ncbi:inositol monophosphatase [Candidatus Peregrinibacteria bacterium]|nr:inositol monophosphatase [Candidatus Peregrinibacteria bacterium]
MTDTQTLIAVAREAAAAAASFLAKSHGEIAGSSRELSVKQKSSAIDLVTDLDAKAQAIIIDCIRSHFPDHRFLAEEEGADALGDAKCPYRWIIDPLDGTTNFIHGSNVFGSIIAVQLHEKTVAGAMNLPLLRKEYWGGLGSGAWANGNRVRLRNTRNMNDAILCCNIVHRASKGDDGILRVTVPDCGSVENYGCAAEELGEILAGHVDGSFFDGIRLWDVAAGFMMIEEAGGRAFYTFKDERNHRSGLICAASTEPIFAELKTWTEERMSC